MGPCWLQIKNPHAENKGVSSGKIHSSDRSKYFPSVDFVVQIRGDRVRPQRCQPIPRDRPRRAKGHATADSDEPQRQDGYESQGEQEGGSVRYCPHLVEQ